MLKRKTPIKRSPLKKKPYVIKKVSDKRKVENSEYSKERKEFFDDPYNQVCQARWECNGAPATDVHHKKGRIGKNFRDKATWLAVCRKCHRRIEADPAEAKRRNFSESRIA